MYRGRLVRAVDGDTAIVRVTRAVDFGFRREMELSSVEEFRSEGIDTPERRGATRAMGELARLYVERACAGELEVWSAGEDEKYGRWLVRLFPLVGEVGYDLVQRMIEEGYGRAYDGRSARLPWDPAVRYPIAA